MRVCECRGKLEGGTWGYTPTLFCPRLQTLLLASKAGRPPATATPPPPASCAGTAIWRAVRPRPDSWPLEEGWVSWSGPPGSGQVRVGAESWGGLVRASAVTVRDEGGRGCSRWRGGGMPWRARGRRPRRHPLGSYGGAAGRPRPVSIHTSRHSLPSRSPAQPFDHHAAGRPRMLAAVQALAGRAAGGDWRRAAHVRAGGAAAGGGGGGAAGARAAGGGGLSARGAG